MNRKLVILGKNQDPTIILELELLIMIDKEPLTEVIVSSLSRYFSSAIFDGFLKFTLTTFNYVKSRVSTPDSLPGA